MILPWLFFSQTAFEEETIFPNLRFNFEVAVMMCDLLGAVVVFCCFLKKNVASSMSTRNQFVRRRVDFRGF